MAGFLHISIATKSDRTKRLLLYCDTLGPWSEDAAKNQEARFQAQAYTIRAKSAAQVFSREHVGKRATSEFPQSNLVENVSAASN